MAFPQLPADAVGTPISSVYVPNDQFRAIGASTLTQTDALGNTYTSANFNLQQINMIAVPMSTADGLSSVLEITQALYNGTSVDRRRGNLDNISLISASGVTTTQTGADQTNHNGRGVIVTLDMTVVGTGSVTLEIDMKDPVSGKYVALLTGAAVITNTTNLYTVYPGAPATANVSANAPLPRTWRVKVVANNANATTYTVAASVIV